MYGQFIKNTAGYEMNTFDLPTSWEYIYENKNILLKVDQFGPVYAQANPPGDIMLFKREQHQKYAPWFVNIVTEAGVRITNYLKPYSTKAEPQNVKISFQPECAIYSFEYEGLRIETEIFIPNTGIQIVYKFRITNIGAGTRNLKICPQMVPYINEAQMAPWDKYQWYLYTTCQKGEYVTMKSALLSPNGETSKRRCGYFLSNMEHLTAHEISMEKYEGFGDIFHPDLHYTNDDLIYGYPPVFAMRYDWTLAPGETKELTEVFSLDTDDVTGYFDNTYYLAKKAERKAVFDKLFSKNKIQTGDVDFDYFANYWVPIQMDWVASLDRGWPTGMRGSRDSAQDYAALLYTDAPACRSIILTMLECQRSDGWFPRQYSAKGKHGKHDLRGHVDGGAFFIELIWKYLAHTRDFAILEEKVAWLDADETSTVLAHVIEAVEYYIKEENIGEHGLCKIREGDWLDGINRAGMEGRGETVTVSAQTVMGLKYLADILTYLDPHAEVQKYLDAAECLKENINTYAFNGEFYNGCFNDNGLWIFSDNDPDDERRIYGVSNYYAVISGVAPRERYSNVLEAAESLKCDKGYRLYYPPLGKKPIEKVGRLASGDAPPFKGENANVYNHGSQGFLARAFSVMGEGEKLFDALKWITPYDQTKHPTEKTWTPPYAIVNCYQQIPGLDHRGLMCFLTGSVAMAMRGIYEWMAGIRPVLDGLEIEPCIPETMDCVDVEFEYLGQKHYLKISGDKVSLDGKELTLQRDNKITGNKTWFVPIEQIL